MSEMKNKIEKYLKWYVMGAWLEGCHFIEWVVENEQLFVICVLSQDDSPEEEDEFWLEVVKEQHFEEFRCVHHAHVSLREYNKLINDDNELSAPFNWPPVKDFHLLRLRPIMGGCMGPSVGMESVIRSQVATLQILKDEGVFDTEVNPFWAEHRQEAIDNLNKAIEACHYQESCETF